MRGSVAIAGVGLAGCGEAPGWTEMEIAVAAAKSALEDAGLTARDVDGVVVASTNIFMSGLALAEHLGLRPKFTESTMVGGSSFVGHLIPAALALNAGLCDTILVAYGSNQRTGVGRAEAGRYKMALDPQPFEHPYQPFNPPTSYALAAARHMHQYGTTREQLAEIAVAARQWAQLNPEAFAREPLTVEDVLGSRMISDPLTVRDCCLVTDGGGALILTKAERAKDFPTKPVYVLGTGESVETPMVSQMEDFKSSRAFVTSGTKAFAEAGIKHSDVDHLMIYDAFAHLPMYGLEDLGFVGRGEAPAFIEAGNTRPGGKLPLNTNGGGLSYMHSGMYGMYALQESVRQMRGTAPAQVPGAKISVCHGVGGMFMASGTIIMSNEAP